jgi:hypothetical protein
MPGGPGPSPSQHHDSWLDQFGVKLTVHHTQGDGEFDRVLPTKDGLQPKKGLFFGVYFSADWCQPCVKFTAVLMAFAKTRATDFTGILVSGCHLADDTRQYFARLPGPQWTAMEHREAVRARGTALRQKYFVSTIPAMVLLDSKGKVICANGRDQLRADPTRKGFPWAPVASGWASDTAGGFRSIQPPGEPPTFDVPTKMPGRKPLNDRKLPAKAATRGEMEKSRAVTWQMDNQVHARARNRAAEGRRQLAETTDVCRWANRRSQNSCGPFWGASTPTNTVARKPSASKRKLEPTKTVDKARLPPKPNLPEMGSKGKPTSLMQPQPLAKVHPFTPTLTEWQHGINLNCGPDWSWEMIEAAVARGPHPTASTPEALKLFKEDIEYKVKAGFSKVIS